MQRDTHTLSSSGFTALPLPLLFPKKNLDTRSRPFLVTVKIATVLQFSPPLLLGNWSTKEEEEEEEEEISMLNIRMSRTTVLVVVGHTLSLVTFARVSKAAGMPSSGLGSRWHSDSIIAAQIGLNQIEKSRPWLGTFFRGGPGCGGLFLRDTVHRGDALLIEGVYSRALLKVGT
jgi:hypothetical protein